MSFAREVESRVLGIYPWGTIRTFGPAHGQEIRELIVYPPGITSRERWAVGLARISPAVGACVGLVLALPFLNSLPSWTFLFFVFVPGAISTVWARRVARKTSRRLRVLRITIDYRTDPPSAQGEFDLFDLSQKKLAALECATRSISPVEYERRWAEIYYQLPPRPEIPGDRDQ